jgi:hypothetical protein
MDFKELLDTCKAEAIANTLIQNEISVWRQICRNYSQKFATPLHMCLDGTIPPEDIMLAEFESQLDGFDEEKDLEPILEQIYRIEDPNYEEEKSKELKDFMAKVAEEERERIRLGKPIHKAMAKEPNLENTSENPIPKELPKSGGINLSYLEKHDISESGSFD